MGEHRRREQPAPENKGAAACDALWSLLPSVMVTKAQLFTSLLVSFGRRLLSEQAAAPMFKILGERCAF